MTPPEMPDDMSPDIALAMDWALGALDREAMFQVEARRRSDPDFARLTDEWAALLSPLDAATAPVAPSAALWGRIAAAIDDAPVTPGGNGLWNSLAFWRGASLASAAAAVALAVVPIGRTPDVAPVPAAAPAAPPGAVMAATLAPGDVAGRGAGGGALIAASFDPSRGAVLLAPVRGRASGGRAAELWLIPADGKPRSLGLIDLGGTRQVAVSSTNLRLVAEGAVLAVTLEPAGGSPTGAPTGPIIAKGALARV